MQQKCRKLKCRKAAGIDNITGENPKYAGKIAYHALKTLFNSITTHKYVPKQFKRAMIITIPNGKNKVLSDKDNYRGISLIPVFAKVYEQLLADWFHDDIGSLSSLQGAAQEQCSSLHSTSCCCVKSYSTTSFMGVLCTSLCSTSVKPMIRWAMTDSFTSSTN